MASSKRPGTGTADRMILTVNFRKVADCPVILGRQTNAIGWERRPRTGRASVYRVLASGSETVSRWRRKAMPGAE